MPKYIFRYCLDIFYTSCIFLGVFRIFVSFLSNKHNGSTFSSYKKSVGYVMWVLKIFVPERRLLGKYFKGTSYVWDN